MKILVLLSLFFVYCVNGQIKHGVKTISHNTTRPYAPYPYPYGSGNIDIYHRNDTYERHHAYDNRNHTYSLEYDYRPLPTAQLPPGFHSYRESWKANQSRDLHSGHWEFENKTRQHIESGICFKEVEYVKI